MVFFETSGIAGKSFALICPYYCTYKESKKLNEFEIQQVYGRATPFLKFQILMFAL